MRVGQDIGQMDVIAILADCRFNVPKCRLGGLRRDAFLQGLGLIGQVFVTAKLHYPRGVLRQWLRLAELLDNQKRLGAFEQFLGHVARCPVGNIACSS